MRHGIRHRKLNRTTAHRRALRRNMAQSLFEHGRITTTLPKAKDMRPFVEKLITLAKRVNAGSRSARIRLVRLLGDRCMIPSEHQAAYEEMTDAKRAKVLRARSGRRYRTGEPAKGMNFTAESVVHRLVTTVAPRYVDRPGGYTRVIKLGKPRLGDAAATAVLQLVGEEEGPGSLPRPEKTARQRRVERRYAFFARAMRGAGKGRGPATPDDSGTPAGKPAPEVPEEKKDETAE